MLLFTWLIAAESLGTYKRLIWSLGILGGRTLSFYQFFHLLKISEDNSQNPSFLAKTVNPPPHSAGDVQTKPARSNGNSWKLKIFVLSSQNGLILCVVVVVVYAAFARFSRETRF